MERIIRFRGGQLQSIDVLREAVKLLTEEVAEALTGARLKELKGYLLETAARNPVWTYLDTRRLDEAADELFELYWECRFLLRSHRDLEGSLARQKLEERAARLTQFILEIYELEPGVLSPELGLLARSAEQAPATEEGEAALHSQTMTILRALERLASGKAEPKTQLRLRLSLAGEEMVVSRYDRPASDPLATSPLPYSRREMGTILKALGPKSIEAGSLSRREQQILLENKVVLRGRERQWIKRVLLRRSTLHLRRDYHHHVGGRLFEALFVGESAELYNRRNLPSKPLALRLFLDPEHPILSRLPWELLRDVNQAVSVARNGVEVSRSLGLEAGLKKRLEIELPLRVLYLDADPKATDEEQALLRALKPLDDENQLQWRVLRKPGWSEIVDELSQNVYSIVHYHGRGVFGRLCAECNYVNPPELETCAECQADLADVEPGGYLLPGVERIVPPISAEQFSLLLNGGGTELVVLDANASATVADGSVFRGIAPSLVRAGVPAVVALQGAMNRPARGGFVRHFYRGLVNEEAIPEAVNSGRRAIFDEAAADWFKPLVYMQAESRYGDLHYVPAVGERLLPDPVSAQAPKVRILPVSPGRFAPQRPADGRRRALVGLAAVLADRFGLEDLRTLAFGLGLDLDDLPAQGKSNLARELVRYFERRQRLPELLDAGRKLRPDIDWEEFRALS